TRVILLPVFTVLFVNPFILESSGRRRVFLLSVIRQRQYCPGEGRVVVAVLDPAVSHQDIVAHPAGGWWRLLRETQRHLIADFHAQRLRMNFLTLTNRHVD